MNFYVIDEGPGSWGLANCCKYAFGSKPSKDLQDWGRFWDLIINNYVVPKFRMPVEYLIYTAEDAMLTLDLAHILRHGFTFQKYKSYYGPQPHLLVKSYIKCTVRGRIQLQVKWALTVSLFNKKKKKSNNPRWKVCLLHPSLFADQSPTVPPTQPPAMEVDATCPSGLVPPGLDPSFGPI